MAKKNIFYTKYVHKHYLYFFLKSYEITFVNKNGIKKIKTPILTKYLEKRHLKHLQKYSNWVFGIAKVQLAGKSKKSLVQIILSLFIHIKNLHI